ncbi:winged helix-turn-helix transcriptional regulator [candidate division KSB1 bacterium]|nr:winged helix-turn-helix transcriptional regulator [candidate division KSB1 bacterium]
MTNIEETSEIFKALSDPTRLKILKILGKSNSMLCVNALTAQLGITQSAVSQHLKILRQAGLVNAERRGYFIHYQMDKKAREKVQFLIKEIL